jgi:transposase
VQLKEVLKEKRRAREGHTPPPPLLVLFLHDKAQAHQALATRKELTCLGFHYLDHPPYSPDLAPSDYHLFPELKKHLKNRHVSSKNEVIFAAEIWLDGQCYVFFLSYLQKLEKRASWGVFE